MQTLQTTPHNMPLPETTTETTNKSKLREILRPDTRADDQHQRETRRTWLQMARVNFIGNPTTKVQLHFADPVLRAVADIGHALAVQLNVLGENRGDEVIDTPIKGRQLRIYLAAMGGALDEAIDLDDAERIVGIRNGDGTIKGEWL